MVGIPCVVSDRDGLPGIGGDTGKIVTELETTERWIDVIHRALDIHDPDAQMTRVERFSAENQGLKLLQLLEEVRSTE